MLAVIGGMLQGISVRLTYSSMEFISLDRPLEVLSMQ
jgi:hypothetical protein